MLTVKNITTSETKRALYINIRNRLVFGQRFPQHGRSFNVKIDEVEKCTNVFHRNFSCSVQSGDWDTYTSKIDENFKYQALKNRFMFNMSWEETGIYEEVLRHIRSSKFQISDGCRNLDEIVERYRRIDDMYSQIEKNSYLESHRHISKKKSELHGVLMHIDRYGNLVFGCAGNHRFFISKLLKIRKIPCLIGVIHSEYVHTFQLKYEQYANSGRLHFDFG